MEKAWAWLVEKGGMCRVLGKVGLTAVASHLLVEVFTTMLGMLDD